MAMNALSVVINHHNSDMIDDINKHQQIEKIVDVIVAEFLDFINDINFVIESQRDIDVWRKLLIIRKNDKLQKFVDRHDSVKIKYDNLTQHFIKDPDEFADTTSLIQATNAAYLLDYKKVMIEILKRDLDDKRQTKCCGKILNSGCPHKHYSFWTMIEDRNNDLLENACKKCRHLWNYDDLYNCEICHLKWDLFYKLFYQYIVRTADVLAPKPIDCKCFYNDYSKDEKTSAGIYDTTASNTYLKNNHDAQTDFSFEEDDVFKYYYGLTDEERDELEENNIDELIFQID